MTPTQKAILQSAEVTQLTLPEEQAFQQWAAAQGIRDVDDPRSFYDYRGYWKNIARHGGDQTQMYPDGLHFSDAYKQHGHPTFSIESQYSEGPWDGGRWVGEDYVPAGADALGTSRRPVDPEFIQKAILALIRRR